VSDSTSPLDAPNTTYLWAQLLVEELVRNGVETAFVAPGSRSTPLTACAARHPDVDVVLHVDERGTAFAALGAGRATGRPAAWITTSGTAVANGLPAVVEASIDDVPMFLLTADRPPELRDTGANQTIDQVKIFGNYVRWEAQLPPPSDDVDPAYVLATVDQAVHRATRSPAGPVHLNCAFRKPLEPVETGVPVAVPDAVRRWADAATPYTVYPKPVVRPSGETVDRVGAALGATERGLVVAGRLDTPAEADAVERLANALGWPLVPDLTSRLRFRERTAHVPHGDLVLTSDAFREAHRPDAVLHVGGRFVSKRLRLFLRESDPPVRAVVRPAPSRVDPDHRATHHVETNIEPFVEQLLARGDDAPGGAEWRAAWAEADERAARVVQRHANDAQVLTEPVVATLLTRQVPSDHALVAASSMPVRDLNRHAATDAAAPTYANRGASGIDGTVATAAGIARGRGGPVTLLIGDLALWHDLNSLALLRGLPVVVLVINNDGGGIFHFLPIHEHEDVFEPYFTAPQGRSFASAADTFGLAYRRPDAPNNLREAYTQACAQEKPALIEVQTDRDANRQVHDALETAVADAVSGSLD